MRLSTSTPWWSIKRWSVLVAVIVLLAACGQGVGDGGTATAPPSTEPPATEPAATTGPTTPPDTPTMVPPTPTAPAAGTAAQALATAGQEVFAEYCVACHGEQGEGVTAPALIGGQALKHFGTARGVFEFARVAMPQDAPGSLPDQQYLEILAFLLLENRYVEPDTVVEVERLGEIALE